MVWAWMLLSPYDFGTRSESWFGHGCSGHCMLLGHERNYDLGMDALVTVCSWNTSGTMVLAWMLWSPHALQDEAAGSTWRHTFPNVPCVSLWRRCMCISCISCAATRPASKSDGNPRALREEVLLLARIHLNSSS